MEDETNLNNNYTKEDMYEGNQDEENNENYNINQEEIEEGQDDGEQNQFNKSFQSIHQFNSEHEFGYSEIDQILYGDQGSSLFANSMLQPMADEIYFHNILNSSNLTSTTQAVIPQKNENNQYGINLDHSNQLRNNSEKQFEQQHQSEIQQQRDYNPTKNNKMRSDSYSLEEGSNQTQKFSRQQIQEQIMKNSELNKKYKKMIACPLCQKSNLNVFEINNEESMFMCINLSCSFPLESDDLLEYTFLTKYKKRIFNKIKNKVHFKYHPTIEVYFEVEDVNQATKELEQADAIN